MIYNRLSYFREKQYFQPTTLDLTLIEYSYFTCFYILKNSARFLFFFVRAAGRAKPAGSDKFILQLF